MSGPDLRDLAYHLVEEDLSARRLAPRSKNAIRAAHKEFFRYVSRYHSGNLAAIGKKELVRYHGYLASRKSKRTGKPLGAHTINDRFHAVSLVFSLLYRAGAIAANPAHSLSLDLPVPAGYKRRPLSLEEITRFLECIDPGTKQGLKDRTLFELIYSSALRVAEAAALKVGDLDFDRRVMVVRGKFDRDRMVPISSVAHDFLVLYLGRKIHDRDAWVFTGSRGPSKGRHLDPKSVSERFRYLLRRFGMDRPEISTHSIRHSTATHLLENGASIRHVQELLGHRCIESTVRYTHVMTDALTREYRKYHPREHELFETVDNAYEARLDSLVAGCHKG